MGLDTNPLPRHFCRLMKNIGSFSNDQAKVVDHNDEMDEFKVEIIPNDGYYRGGRFEFSIQPENYPNQAPTVCCLTQVYHPNIDLNDGVCLNLLDEWDTGNDLEDLVQGLLFLFYNPNLDDPLSTMFEASGEEANWEHGSFEANVRVSLEGGVVEDVSFDRNLVEDFDNEAIIKTETNSPTEDCFTCDKSKSETTETGKWKVGVDEEFNVVDIYFPELSVVWMKVRPA